MRLHSFAISSELVPSRMAVQYRYGTTHRASREVLYLGTGNSCEAEANGKKGEFHGFDY